MLHDRYVYPFVYDSLNSLNGVSVLQSLTIERRRKKDFLEAVKANAKDRKLSMPLRIEVQYLWLTSEISPAQADNAKAKRR